MLPGNAKSSMTSLADTKHIFRERKIYLFIYGASNFAAGKDHARLADCALRARRDYKAATLGITKVILRDICMQS